MFSSHEKNSNKKAFQKPNILRRKSKVSTVKANQLNVYESPQTQSLVNTQMEEPYITDHIDNIINLESNDTTKLTKTVWMTVANNSANKHVLKSEETDIDANPSSNVTITEIINVSNNVEQNSLNIESFINGTGSIEQDMTLSYDASVSTDNKTESKWCFDVTSNCMDTPTNYYKDQQLENVKERESVIVVPSSLSYNVQHNIAPSSATTTQTIAVDCYSNRAVKFKCDEPNCNKGFWSAEKLKKHKNSHSRQVFRTPTQITYECPVKKVEEDGSEVKCPRTFKVRGDLLKHLNEDHTLDEAQHRCSVCGRRFFWATGLRAHGASWCARGGLACAWPGCGRVFRLPCRLREHARAHTGDRPYRCRYPDCGWAFRSASKLVRHARRHTDERKHACGACGRAFLRREHLRDHCARHHTPSARPTHLCTHTGCGQTFTNMSTLYMHMKKVHRKVEEASDAPVAENAAPVGDDEQNIYLISLESGDITEENPKDETLVRSQTEGERAGAACQAARTHMTWPLERAAPPAHAHYALDDDAQVERTEGSSSDVYTVRSDLFLHGNVPIDEDSQQIVGASLCVGGAEPLDADLGLIDPHPTIDLMQEGLMYEDAADESSFRVLLMNGEELT